MPIKSSIRLMNFIKMHIKDVHAIYNKISQSRWENINKFRRQCTTTSKYIGKESQSGKIDMYLSVFFQLSKMRLR